jgi:hypothetical protein
MSKARHGDRLNPFLEVDDGNRNDEAAAEELRASG